MTKLAVPSKTSPSAKTKTLPESERDGFYDGPDPITWLHIVGTALFFALPRKRTITVGSSSASDVVVKAPYVSRRHCTLTRLYDGIRIEDHSKNGTWIDHRAASERPREVHPGGTFTAGGVTFVALNDEMRARFSTLSEILDWEDDEPLARPLHGWPSPSNVIVWGSGADPLLVIGPRGCGQQRLVEAIHAISPMRERALVSVDEIPADRGGQKDLLLRAQKATLVVSIGDDIQPIDPAFGSMLFSPSYRVRVLVCAPSFDRAQKALGSQHACMRRIELRPLAFRTDQLGRILDHQLEQVGSPLRFEQLTATNRNALMTCEWRRNLDDLQIAAQRLAAIERTGSLRKAAVAVGIKHFNVMQKWYSDTMRLKLPLKSSR